MIRRGIYGLLTSSGISLSRSGGHLKERIKLIEYKHQFAVLVMVIRVMEAEFRVLYTSPQNGCWLNHLFI